MRRVSRTTLPRPFLLRNALTAASAAAGLSGCTGRAAYSGDTKVTEQPGARMHGRRHSAMVGVATMPIRVAAKSVRLSTPFPPIFPLADADGHLRSSACIPNGTRVCSGQKCAPRRALAAERVIEEIEDVLDQPIIKLRLIHRQVLSSLLW